MAFFENEHLDLLKLDSIYLRPTKSGIRISDQIRKIRDNPESGRSGQSGVSGFQTNHPDCPECTVLQTVLQIHCIRTDRMVSPESGSSGPTVLARLGLIRNPNAPDSLRLPDSGLTIRTVRSVWFSQQLLLTHAI